MLCKLWPLLAENGLLLYATCSVFQRENEQQIEWFLENTENAQHLVIDADWGEQRPMGGRYFQDKPAWMDFITLY